MTFAALLVIQKREKKKSFFMFLRGSSRRRPLQDKAQVPSTDKRKIKFSIRFFFCTCRRKRKSYQKENAEIRFRALRSATTAVGGRHRLPQKAGENFNYGGRKLIFAKTV